jgi:hypothetical protein
MRNPTTSEYPVITVLDKAVEKDEFGKVYSQGTYTPLGLSYGECNNRTFKSNAAFILNDMQQSPIITCLTSVY